MTRGAGWAAPVAAISIAAVLLGACSGPAAKEAVQAPPSPSAPPVPTTGAPPPDTTVAPPDVGGDLEAPDATAIARRALEAPYGRFERSDGDSRLVEVLQRRLSPIDPGIQAVAWELLAAGDERVMVASLYPHADLRGDPSVLETASSLIAGDDPPTVERIGGHEVAVIEGEDTWWYLWANHTHLLVAAGPRTAAADRIAQLADFNADEYLWRPGDCIAIAPEDGFGLPYSPHGADVVVPCDQPHQYEVVAGDRDFFTGEVDAPATADAYASTLGWCEGAFADRIGGQLFDSSLETAQFFPDRLEWARGDRYAACLTFATEGGAVRVVDEAYAGRGEEIALRRVVGDCHTWSAREPVVDCGDPHDLEYLGETAGPDVAWLEGADVAVRRCRRMLEATAGDLEVDGVTLDTTALTTGPAAWDGGDRRIACFAVADTDGLPVRIVGSVGGDWAPAAAPDDGFTT